MRSWPLFLLLIPAVAIAAFNVGGIDNPASVGGIDNPVSVGGIDAGSGSTAWNPSLATDPNLVAWYEFEDSGDLGRDSKNSNDLDVYNCVKNTSQYMRGTGALLVDGDTQVAEARIYTANLPSDWPGKTGASDVVTLIMWLYVNSTNEDILTHVVSMYDTSSSLRSWGFSIDWNTTPDEWGILAGYNSGASAENKWINSPAPQIQRWYFVAMVIDGDNDTYLLRIYDYTAAAWLDFDSGTGGQQDYSGSYTNDVFSLTGTKFTVGRKPEGGGQSYCTIDDLMIFKTALSVSQINSLMAGTY